MICVIHQAYFLPWLGYFSKLSFVDKFIVLDNVNFTKGFYYDRTQYISGDGQIKWLSLPIGQCFMKKCNEVTVPDIKFLDNLLRTLEGSYAKADYYKRDWPILRSLIIDSFNDNQILVDINISLIKGILALLEISPPEFIKASLFGEISNKTDRVKLLCEFTNCNSIIIGDGASFKQHDWKHIAAANILVLKQSFFDQHPIYKQVRRQRLPFQKGISIIDCILNVGFKKTKELITGSIYEPKLIEIYG